MAVDYAAIAAEVAGAFAEVRQGTVTLTRSVAGTPNPASPWVPVAPTVTTYTLDAIASAVTVDQANAKFIDGNLITVADLVVTCSVPPIVPQMTDILAIDGQARAIKKIVQVPAAGDPVLFKLFVQG